MKEERNVREGMVTERHSERERERAGGRERERERGGGDSNKT